MRQRMNPAVAAIPKDYRGWLFDITNPKVEISHLNYLISIRDPAKSGLGFRDNRHLNYFVESINMNVGDSYQNVIELRINNGYSSISPPWQVRGIDARP
jgi:hypothetical protein